MSPFASSVDGPNAPPGFVSRRPSFPDDMPMTSMSRDVAHEDSDDDVETVPLRRKDTPDIDPPPRQPNKSRNFPKVGIGLWALLLLAVLVPVVLMISQSNLFGGGGGPETPADATGDLSNENFHHLKPTSGPDKHPHKPHETVRKAVILASYSKQLTGWVHDLHKVSQGWEVFRYIADATEDDDIDEEFPDATNIGLGRNDAREALPYLTFILNHYDNLPDYIAFVHGHRHAWHQPQHIVDKLMALNISHLEHEGYVNFRCQQNHGCTPETMFNYTYVDPTDHANKKDLQLFWEDFLEEQLGAFPFQIARPCCSQFAVTKAAIRARPYRFWYDLASPYRKDGWRGRHKHKLGLMFELVWHVIFGKPAVYCPSRTFCDTVAFQDALKCLCVGETPCIKDGKVYRWANLPCTNSLRHQWLDSAWPGMRDREGQPQLPKNLISAAPGEYR